MDLEVKRVKPVSRQQEEENELAEIGQERHHTAHLLALFDKTISTQGLVSGCLPHFHVVGIFLFLHQCLICLILIHL